MDKTKKYSFAAKWLWLLFLIVVPSNIFSLFTNENIITSFPILRQIGSYGSILCTAVYGMILIRLSSEFYFYRTAGICYLCTCIISFITSLSNNETSGFIIFTGLIGGILTLVAIFSEFSGHCDMLIDIDHDLYVKWNNLKLLFTICYSATLVCIFLSVIFPLISAIILLIALIAILIGGILKFVYLYKSSRFLKKLSTEENVSRETF